MKLCIELNHSEKKDPQHYFKIDLNLKKLNIEKIMIRKESTPDEMTEMILSIMKNYSFSEKDIQRAFVVIQELFYFILSLKEPEICLRMKYAHDTIFLILKGPSWNFDLWKTLEEVRKELSQETSNYEKILDGKSLGLYMLRQNADYFNGSRDGSLLGIKIKKS